jgi:hypothetical protein
MSLILERTGNLEFCVHQDTQLFGVAVPEGFRTNGVTVPQPLWCFISPFTYVFEPSIIHDFRYAFPGDISRSAADAEFLRNMRSHGVSWLTRWCAYLAVRIFGAAFFNPIRNVTYQKGRHWSSEYAE